MGINHDIPVSHSSPLARLCSLHKWNLHDQTEILCNCKIGWLTILLARVLKILISVTNSSGGIRSRCNRCLDSVWACQKDDKRSVRAQPTPTCKLVCRDICPSRFYSTMIKHPNPYICVTWQKATQLLRASYLGIPWTQGFHASSVLDIILA
jgi:hypothetical protein